MSLELFAQLSHALATLRRDTIGEIDKAMFYNLDAFRASFNCDCTRSAVLAVAV